MTGATELQTAIEDAYGLLWLVVTDDPRLHAARARLLSTLTREGQKRGIQVAKNMFGPTTATELLQLDDHPKSRRFTLKDRVRKTKGSSWQGRVVGFYSTELTPIGYCVESEREPGSVQIYPESALEALS